MKQLGIKEVTTFIKARAVEIWSFIFPFINLAWQFVKYIGLVISVYFMRGVLGVYNFFKPFLHPLIICMVLDSVGIVFFFLGIKYWLESWSPHHEDVCIYLLISTAFQVAAGFRHLLYKFKEKDKNLNHMTDVIATTLIDNLEVVHKRVGDLEKLTINKKEL